MKKLFSTRISDNAFSFAAFIFRVGVGSLMMVNHGLDKLTHFAKYSSQFPSYFGIGSATWLSLLVFAEFFCTAFIILGLFTRLAAIPLVIAMGVALFSAHKGDFFGKGESAGLYLVVFLAILIMGAGKASLDKLISK